MPTKKLFGKTFDARPDRLDLRDLPYRAPLVGLPSQYPSAEIIEHYLPCYSATDMVLDQGQEGACTGFGLAAVINYLKWEPWLRSMIRAGKDPIKETPPTKISERMLYQNARLYDEWKGEDYDGSSCRGAIKGFHKHGVCRRDIWPYLVKGKPGKPKPEWRENAAQTPLGAYYRIDTGSLADLQAAIYEVHAVYVSASVHSGWRIENRRKSLEDATIQYPGGGDTGGHAFALVGYTPQGFIVQNSWGRDWGYNGFALLTYTDWSEHASDAWVLALGAPISSTAKSPQSRTAVTLEERANYRVPLRAAEQRSQITKRARVPQVIPWTKNEESEHIVFIGQDGRADREIVAAIDAEDAVRVVTDKAANSGLPIAIYCHGGLNNRDEGVRRAQILGPWLLANGVYPIFIVWQTGFLEAAQHILSGAPRDEAALARARGRVLEKLREEADRGFEIFARNMGVRAVWEDMKSRAVRASSDTGGMALVAKLLARAMSDKTKLHLIGHSAGAIMIGAFLGALTSRKVKAASLHLWAPACTVSFASATYAKAFASRTIAAKSTYISVLSDENELADESIPVLYSKSLLYLVSRALEAEHKTPLLGLHRILDKEAAKDDIFKNDLLPSIRDWITASKGIQLDRPVAAKEVPTRRRGRSVEMIPANHGSFDNNIDVVNLAIERILGAGPELPVTDLRGF
jgi:hypothetical protein